MADHTIGGAIRDYLAELGARSASWQTKRHQKNQLALFERFCHTEGIADVRGISRQTIARYLGAGRERGCSQNTLASAGKVVRVFLRWLVAVELVPKEIRFECPRPSIKVPRILSPEEIGRMIAACRDGTALGRRDEAAIELLFGTGCRISEAIALRLRDLDLARSEAKCCGKGDAERILVLTPTAVAALRTYIERYRVPIEDKHGRSNDALFLTYRGTPIRAMRLGEAVKKRGKQAGLQGIHAHLLRHAAATHMLRASGNFRMAQVYLGHRSAQSTARYTQVMTDDLHNAVARHHPRGEAPAARIASSAPTDNASPALPDGSVTLSRADLEQLLARAAAAGAMEARRDSAASSRVRETADEKP